MSLAALRTYAESVPKSTSVQGSTGEFSGNVTIGGALDHDGTTAGFYGKAPVARAAAIAAPTAPGAIYVQSEAAAMKTAIDAIRTALTNIGLTA